MENIGLILVVCVFAFIIYRSRGNLKQMFKNSREAPQHWSTFALLMLGVILFVYLLIKL